MKLPKEEILINSPYRRDLEPLLKYAEQALREWSPIWTPFLPAQLLEEVKKKFNHLIDLTCNYEGGYSHAERQRICFRRTENKNNSSNLNIPIEGLYLKGNFLFDRAKPNEFREAIQDLGIKEDEIGDIWLIRDRGAQAICSKNCADLISNRLSKLREVEIKIQKIAIPEMEIPLKRAEKTINTVEASTRIDAIASAGFGLSRSKITTQIKQGLLRLNWITNYQPNKTINIGDLIHLEKKGSLRILKIDKTKKERWRIKIQRQ